MPRRRLRLHSPSDEEDENQNAPHSMQPNPWENLAGEEEEDEIEVQLVASTDGLNTVTLHSPQANASPLEHYTVEISDDDFMDVPEQLSPPQPSTSPSSNHSFPMSHRPSPTLPESTHSFEPPSSSGPEENFESSGYSFGNYLSPLGLNLKREWLRLCVDGLERCPGFSSLDASAKAKLCFQQFLFSDMNFSGGGVLPANICGIQNADLSGPFVLQVDEIVNISLPLRGRYQNAPCGMKRCLKLSMTDGIQRVFGMEYRPIKDLEVLAIAGLKIVVRNVTLRRGLLMLVPETVEVLGGSVDKLEEARQRLVNEVNKPPRGKRSRNGILPPLAARASEAAWPSSISNNLGNSGGSVLQETATSHSYEEELPSAVSALNVGVAVDVPPPFREGNAETEETPVVPSVDDLHMVDGLEHPFVVNEANKMPFTYLANLSAKWATRKAQSPSVQGKIKCFVTGVKGFQYKQRSSFLLEVYVDDGSLISEMLIDHNVVERGIGHSPQEVTLALTNSDKRIVSDMKEKLKQFQVFLAKFEEWLIPGNYACGVQ